MSANIGEKIAVARRRVKRLVIGALAVGIATAGYSAREGDDAATKIKQPAAGNATEISGADTTEISRTDTTAILKRGVTLRNEIGNSRSICGAAANEHVVTVVQEAVDAFDKRWIQIASVAGEWSVRQAPFDDDCVAQPWASASGLKPQ